MIDRAAHGVVLIWNLVAEKLYKQYFPIGFETVQGDSGSVGDAFDPNLAIEKNHFVTYQSQAISVINEIFIHNS